jgi:hypothetical protein
VGQRVAVLKLLCKKLRTALQPQSSISWMSGKVPRGLSTPHYTPSVTPLQGVSHPYSSPLPSRTSAEQGSCAHFDCRKLLYFVAGAGVDVLGAGAAVLGAGVGVAGAGVGVAGAGAGFTAVVLGADVVGAAELLAIAG